MIKAALGAQSSGTEPKVINIISIGRSKPSKRDAKRLLSSLGVSTSTADQNVSQDEVPQPAAEAQEEAPQPADEEPAAAENKQEEEEQTAPEEQQEASTEPEEQNQEEPADEDHQQEEETHEEEQHDEQPASGRQSSAHNKSSTSLHSQSVLNQSQSSQSLAGRQSQAASSHRGGDQTGLKSTTSIVSQANPSQSSTSLARKSNADVAPSVANLILLSPSVVSEKKPVDDGAFDPDQYLSEVNKPPCPPPLPVPPRPASTRSILAPQATASVATVTSLATVGGDNLLDQSAGSTAFKSSDDDQSAGSTAFKASTDDDDDHEEQNAGSTAFKASADDDEDSDDQPEQSAGSTAFRAATSASQSLRAPSSTSNQNVDNAGKTPRASTVGFNLSSTSTAAAAPSDEQQSTRSRTTSKVCTPASRVSTPAKPVYVLTKVSRYIRKEITTEITCECK